MRSSVSTSSIINLKFEVGASIIVEMVNSDAIASSTSYIFRVK